MADPKPDNPVVDAAVNAAMDAVTETAAKRDNNLSTPAVREAKPELIEAMTEAVAATPEVQHVTNTEDHWYQKRTSWAAIIGPACFIMGMALKLTGYDYSFGLEEQGLLADALAALGVFVAAVFARWAGIATKPLFSK